MSVLNRDDFFNRIQNIVGTDVSDDSLSFIEDMNDTYNDLESRANGDGIDWQQRYNELDEAWKEKYKKRFFSGGSSYTPKADKDPDPQPSNVDYEDLFDK